MKFLSLFSGIEAASSAWGPLGWECVGVSDVDPYACAALAHHYPHVPNLGDVTKITELDIARLTARVGGIDVIIFGSPCQGMSVAGKRKGFSDDRSVLFFSAMQIISWARFWGGARFALWENVPGAFSSNAGRDFAAVVDAMAGLDGTEPPPKGWGTEGCAVGTEAMVEWATLDAQWFGVAQRRRRVFAVADFGDWANRQPILLEPQGLRGDSPPSREAGKGVTHDVTPGLTSSGRGVARPGDTRGQDPVVAFGGNNQAGPIDVATARNACASASGRMDFESETFLVQPCVTGAITHTLKAEGFDASEDGTGRGTPIVPVAFVQNSRDEVRLMGGDGSIVGAANPTAVAFQSSQSGVRLGDTHATLDANNGPRRHNGALIGMQVRRLTPVESERLQGFVDGHTRIPSRFYKTRKITKLRPADMWDRVEGGWVLVAADGPRYKAIGNSMAVPVIEWIGRRIEAAAR